MRSGEEIVNVIGVEAMEKLCSAFGGERVYIPKKVPQPDRTDSIKEEYIECLHEGATCMAAYASVANHYELSVRRVQSIVAL